MRMLDRTARWAERLVFPLNRIVHKVGLAILMMLMLLTVGDVAGRYLFGRPIPGTFELTQFMLALIVFCSIGFTQVCKAHISIDVMVSRFSPRARAIIDSVTCLLSLGLFSVVTWQSAVHAVRTWRAGEVAGVLPLPIYPFVFAVALGSLLFCLVLAVNLLTSMASVVKHEP